MAATAAFKTPGGSHAPFVSAAQPVAHVPPAGTFAPGTKVQVGNHRVVIERYLSEGGFAHVYVVRLPKPIDGNDLAVLKRVAVPDKENLANMRTEVETMKRLRGHRYIVKYMDSHASQLKGGGYEVFLLMEFCSGGGLIDFMNTRLQNRLTEPEILKIFTDVAEGVAAMHYLKPPLLHRDLKVENVLITKSGSTRTYKLCDFGSAAPARPAATSAAEGRLIEDDVQRHTTLQYRSPEMVDVYRKQPIDEKSDIWALGVFLYKLCYYTTPFEEMGQMAILNASFKYPAYPKFSDQLKLLIACMLRENPAKRPNIYQVLQQACRLEGRDLPVKDIYSNRSDADKLKNPTPGGLSSSQPRTGAILSPPQQQPTLALPDIAPMRRGRPEKPVSHHSSAKPSPSPLRMIESTDPFAVLDGGNGKQVDELSSRFPTLDQFSLLTDKEKRMQFDRATPSQPSTMDESLSKRVTEALADKAFARPTSPIKGKPLPPATAPSIASSPRTVVDRQQPVGIRDERAASQPSTTAPFSSRTSIISPGIVPSNPQMSISMKALPIRPIQRFPSSKLVPRASSQSRASEQTQPSSTPTSSGSRLADLLRSDASKSLQLPEGNQPTTSSRPSLEGGRPIMKELDAPLSRSRSLNLRARPVSLNIGPRSTQDTDQDIKRTSSYEKSNPETAPLRAVESETNIASDIDFLKAKEEEEKNRRANHKRLSSGSRHGKRSSLPSISSAGKRFAGRFGDAFRMFEGNHDSAASHDKEETPINGPHDALSPITGSEATDLSDDRYGLEEIEDIPPEMRRELEKSRLEAEERRVVKAAAEYRRRLAERRGGPGGGQDGATRAAAIQSKVQSLLKENARPPPKTVTGYGRFTDANGGLQAPTLETNTSMTSQTTQADPVARDMKAMSAPSSAIDLQAQVLPSMPSRTTQKPLAPPKPQVLRTGGGATKPPSLPGATTMPEADTTTVTTTVAEALGMPDDWEENFSKRYPSLSGLEMVETAIDDRPRDREREQDGLGRTTVKEV